MLHTDIAVGKLDIGLHTVTSVVEMQIPVQFQI
jgi:hypothetical protein